ncbi:toll-like receptor Tollo [Microplitis mediator]|uniref:toll-like receptor Tollo n=1 Tax=Microplitis mediator TaxID=375433 RepID=UPI0025522445|nr:toll-like receptor Tollo [Microplitis mediator]
MSWTLDILFGIILLGTITYETTTARSITSLEAPRGCDWSNSNTNIQTLGCKLRTIGSAEEIIGNLSSIQLESIENLKLQCNDVLLFESQFENTNFLGACKNLRTLDVEKCKVRYVPAGAFSALKTLQLLTLQSFNNDWSGMTLELHRDSLRGLDALQELYLPDNNIWTLPAEILCPVTNLKKLNLTRNKLQDTVSLGFTDWTSACTPNLESLDLSDNDMSVLPDNSFVALKKLKALMLQDNKIRHVGDHALAGLGQLMKLNISSNRLVALPPELFSDTADLLELVLSNNSLSVIAPGLLDNLTKLKNLDLSSNELTSHWVNRDTFTRLRELLFLDLSFNALTKIDSSVFKGLVSLQILKLEHNNIDILVDGCFSALQNLQSLTLSHNRITRFEATHTLGLNSVMQLFLDGNKLRILHRRTFSNLTNLQDISLSGNAFTEIPESIRELKTLKTLDLGNNKISKVDNESFYGLNELYGLRLVDNKLENISRDTFSTLPALQVLNLASNVIRHVEQNAFASNSVLRAVRLDGNQLTEIRGVFTTATTLVWLNISDNKLLWFDYSYLPANLEWLDMHNNQISELGNYYTVHGNLKIKMLDASWNLITEIMESSIPDGIETLFLNNNNIRSVAPSTFLRKTSLEKVVLYGNEIRHLDLTALGIQEVPMDRNIPEFYIGDNPILCDCSMEWLPKINDLSRSRQHPRVMDLDAVMCEMVHKRASPKRPLLSLKPKDFLCHYDAHCFALCHCCDFDACDCEMTCPDNCSCYHDHSWSSNVVDCSNGGYKMVPERIPMDATEIYLDGNNLGDLGSHVFIGKRRLEVLFLNNSKINTLHNRTFNGAPSLRVLHLEDNGLRELRGFEFDQLEQLSELYLDHNAIAMVGNTTFNKMKSLQVLRLDSNRIVDFRPWEVLADAGAGARVALEGNAWNCECINTAKLKVWLAHHPDGDAEKMYCKDGTETLAEALRRCGDPSTEAVSREISKSSNNFVPLLAGALVVIIVVCLVTALAFAFRQDVRLWLHSRYGWRLGKPVTLPDEERDRLYDGYIIYNERDQDFVSGCLSAELEQSGLSLCLHYRDLPPARPQEALPPAAGAARRIVLVFSPVFLANEWQHIEFRSALRCALETIRPSSRRRRVVLLLAAEAPRNDPELQLLLQTCEVIVWGDKRFWEKLRFAMPDPEDKSSGKKVDRCPGSARAPGMRVPARYTAAPSAPADLWTKPNGILVAPVHHAPTPTPTQSTYVSSASSRTEDEDSGAEHQHHGYSALHGVNGRPASLSSRGSHLYSTIPEPPTNQGTINPRTYFV